MKHIFSIFCLFVASCTSVAFARTFDHSLDQAMTFKLAGTGGNCDTCSWIAAEGTISLGTPREFLEFMSAHKDRGGPPHYLHINSRGGALFGAIELGELFRKFELSIYVAKTLGEVDPDNYYVDDRGDPREQAICASACVVAFVGGYRRLAISDHYSNAISVIENPQFLVHQFYSADALIEPDRKKFSSLDRSSDQIVSGILLEYFNRMGVSSKLFELMSKVPPNRNMFKLSDLELVETGLENVSSPPIVELSVVGKDAAGVKITRNTHRSAITTWITCNRKRQPIIESIISIPYRETIKNLKDWSIYSDMRLTTEGTVTTLRAIDLKVTEQGNGSVIVTRHLAEDLDVDALVEAKRFAFDAIQTNPYSTDAAWGLFFVLPANFNGMRILPRACSR